PALVAAELVGGVDVPVAEVRADAVLQASHLAGALYADQHFGFAWFASIASSLSIASTRAARRSARRVLACVHLPIALSFSGSLKPSTTRLDNTNPASALTSFSTAAV